MMTQRHSSLFSRGFTMVELMITVLIIGLLASIATPMYQGYIAKARYTTMVNKIDPIKQWLTLEASRYPSVNTQQLSTLMLSYMVFPNDNIYYLQRQLVHSNGMACAQLLTTEPFTVSVLGSGIQEDYNQPECTDTMRNWSLDMPNISIKPFDNQSNPSIQASINYGISGTNTEVYIVLDPGWDNSGQGVGARSAIEASTLGSPTYILYGSGAPGSALSWMIHSSSGCKNFQRMNLC